MKMRSLIAAVFAAIGFLENNVSAQIVGVNCFLQGAFVEVGIAPNGSWGAGASPGTYHGGPGPNIAVVYDYGHDGWAVGTPPKFGDYIYPGTPFEGWSVQVGGNRTDCFYSSGPSSFTGPGGLTGSNTGYYYTPGTTTCGYPMPGGSVTGVWEGTMASGALSIRQLTTIDTSASWVLVNTVFKNTSAATLTGLYYHRTCDPDNDQTISGDFITDNVITYQDDADHRVMAGSYGTHPLGTPVTKAYLAIGTKDCRAKSLIYASWPPPAGIGNNLDLIYDGTTTSMGATYYTLGDVTASQDIAIGLVYRLGDLPPGDSTMISYAYIFKDSLALDSVFREPQLVVNCVPKAPSGPAPAPTYDTFNTCLYPGITTIPVYVKYGGENNWSWSKWTWAPATGLSSTTGLSNNINVAALSSPTTYTITGTNTGLGMNNCAQRVFYLTVYPCHSAYSNSPGTGTGWGNGIGAPSPDATNSICEGDTLKLFDKGDSTGATYLWYGPGPTIAGAPIFAVQQPVKYPTTMADTGWYHVIKTVAGSSDTVDIHVLFRKRPNVTATYNPPVCETNTLNLFSNPDYPSETWTWTGPGGYTSTLSDPSRTPATVAMSGDYKVVTELFGCFDSSSISVVVNPMPVAPAMSYNTVLCEDSTLYLSSSSSPGATYTWSGPTSFSSTLQNPTISGVKPTLHNGTYTVTAALGVCTISSTITLSVTPTHEPILGSNSPVCSGNSLNFTASPPVPGCTFAWTGPLGFTSTLQYPSINPAFTPNSGIYYVIATLDSCPSLLTPISVVVDSTPEVPVLSTNSPGPPGNTICQEDTLTFTAFSPTGAGVTYHWYGPSSFSSTQQNPVILPATPVNSGVYTVIATLGACTSTATIAATVTPTPPISVSSNSAICAGDKDTVKLFATGNPGSTFTWIGPYTFFSAAANPVRTPAMVEYSGPYTATVLLDGCTNTAIVDYKVKPVPAPPMTKWLTFCQYYDAPYLQAFGTNVLWYPSSDPTAAGTSVAPKPPTDAVGVQFYYVTQTLNGCTSAIDSFRVRIDPTPTVTVSEGADVCPRDSVKLVATNPDAIAYYHWSPPLYLSDTASAVVTAYPETDVEYMVISSNVYGCSDTGKVSIRVKDNAVLHIPDSVLIFPGESYHIQPMTNCSRFTWTPSGGLTGKYISNPVATPEISTKYVVTGVTEDGCIVKDSILIRVNDESAITVPNAFAPGRGNNDLFKVIRRGDATLRHFRVYNRWGTVVFQTTNIDEGWDGTYKGTPQPVGVYVYEVSAVSSNGKEIVKTGNVTLLR
ncbi:MAG: gliding motility-associated C-terminal domain-containing protein [Taibaiella sp.]|nr:gliding motility-associated C-terminal domain-containing protein [Taibaiella sp.]